MESSASSLSFSSCRHLEPSVRRCWIVLSILDKSANPPVAVLGSQKLPITSSTQARLGAGCDNAARTRNRCLAWASRAFFEWRLERLARRILVPANLWWRQRVVQAPWACLDGSSSSEAMSLARGSADHADARWVLAMVHWNERRYSEALSALLEPSVVCTCDSLWIYHNLLGMVTPVAWELARHSCIWTFNFLEPDRPDTLYNYANLLKDDPERAVVFYLRSLKLQPDAAAAWHNYGSTLTNLTRYHEALFALRLSLCLDPLVADVVQFGLGVLGLKNLIVLSWHSDMLSL